jgi:hypothetical protein
MFQRQRNLEAKHKVNEDLRFEAELALILVAALHQVRRIVTVRTRSVDPFGDGNRTSYPETDSRFYRDLGRSAAGEGCVRNC